MAKCWRITGYDGERIIFEQRLFDGRGHRQIEKLLSLLQASQMTADAIIEATKGDADALAPVRARTAHAPELTTKGQRVYFTADEEDV